MPGQVWRSRCFGVQNALRIDKENQQILRDLSLLQIQRRYYEGFQVLCLVVLGWAGLGSHAGCTCRKHGGRS